VAIKYLETNLVRDADFLWRYRAEVERLLTLDAAHVVRLFDFVEQPGEGAAVVMELVDGVSLRTMIDRGRNRHLSPAGALVMLKDTLLGLGAAHSRRLPHRDVKPDNVLVDAGGWCTLTDFGVAVKPDKQMPAAGTPAYLAPELWNGAENVPATDVYAATVTFYESLTGRPPFSGRLSQLRHQHESTLVALDRVDPPLRDLIAWGMAKDPADRPRGTRSFLGQVEARAAAAYGPQWEDQGRHELAERATALIPLLAAGGGSSAMSTRLARRKVLIFASVAAVAVLAIGGVAAATVLRPSENAQLSSLSASTTAAQVAVTPPVVESKCTTATTFTYSGSVTATERGTLTYRWLYSTGKQGPVQTLNFSAPRDQQVSGGTVKASKTGSGWAEIKLLSPAAKTSNRATYRLMCGAANGKIVPTASAGATAPATSRTSAKASASPTTTKAKATPAPTATKTTTRPTPTPTPKRTTTKPTPTPRPTRTTTTPTPTPTASGTGAPAGGAALPQERVQTHLASVARHDRRVGRGRGGTCRKTFFAVLAPRPVMPSCGHEF
jgi:eukaryotic-like serine/threonine-protein kinase